MFYGENLKSRTCVITEFSDVIQTNPNHNSELSDELK